MITFVRSLGVALQAEQVGIATLGTMHAQEEQMARIGEEVEDASYWHYYYYYYYSYLYYQHYYYLRFSLLLLSLLLLLLLLL